MKKNIKTALSVTAVVLVFALVFVFLNMLLQPK